MKHYKPLFLIVLLALILMPQIAPAQSEEDAGKQQKYFPLSVSVFNESTSIPGTVFIDTPIHPGIQLGTEFKWNRSFENHLYQTANLGYFFHNHLFQAVIASSELGYDYRFKFGLSLKTRFGVGYMLAMPTQRVYSFENGEYREIRGGVMSKFQATLSIGAGYRFKPSAAYSPEVFILYQAGAIVPFSAGFIPAITQTNFHIGVMIPIRIR